MSALPFPSIALLLAGVVLAGLSHAAKQPVWVAALAAAIIGWRAWAGFSRVPLPRRWLMIVAALVALVAVFAQYRTLFGRDVGVTLLIVLLSLKLLEMRTVRDATVVAFLCFFLSLTGFFHTQSMQVAGLAAVTLLLLSGALVGFNAPRRPVADNLKTGAVLLAQGVPVMLALFLLFPRIDGPLWRLPSDVNAATTGLSDTMTPGNISALTQSDAIALRARFESLPPRAALYWRGPVLSEFDGRTWRIGRAPTRGELPIEGRGEPVAYEVTIEPHERNWVFALEMPAVLPDSVRMTSEYLMLSRSPLRNRARFELRSFPAYRVTGGASPAELELNRILPAGFNPRARELALGWRAELGRDDAIVQRGFDYFRQQGFQYTLEPPLLGEHSVDEFLFSTRRGFCEHFSAAFVVLMRAAGVPARVVTGYQGGEINPVDGYLVVRQADAHAWAEVWLGERGWVRVDPTAAVAPVRVESGIAAAVPAGEPLPLILRTQLDWIRSLRFNWEAITNRWNQWILGYTSDRQREFLSRLGMQRPDWQKMTVALVWAVGICLAVLAAWVLARRRTVDPVQRLWLAFCSKLARAGTPRRPDEGPESFARRAATAHPDRAKGVRTIASLYAALRYGPRPDPASLARLRRLVREFRV